MYEGSFFLLNPKQIQQYYGMWSQEGRSCTGGIRQGKETKNLNVVDVLSVNE
jgi:hypothetical protein